MEPSLGFAPDILTGAKTFRVRSEGSLFYDRTEFRRSDPMLCPLT
jgi:hypothetical protein